MTRLRSCALVATTLVAVVSLMLIAPNAGAQGDEVEVTVQPGLAGVVSEAPRMPVRVTLRSDSSRTVKLELTTSLGTQYYEVELNAGAPNQTDAVLLSNVDRIEATVRAPNDDSLGSGDIRLDPKNISANVVGVGASIAGEKEPWVTSSIAKIDRATLIPLDSSALDRPGALDALNGLVLGPADVERLSDDQQRRISSWVAQGGNLALDQAPIDPLPVLGTTAEAGARTAVAAGWVRFTDGGAASGDWSKVIEPAGAIDSRPDGNQIGDDMDFGGPGAFYDEVLGSTGFLQVSYLPSWVISLAVLLTALLVGPVLWWVLRSRRRRRLMWIAAPALSLLVAGVLLVVGRGALADASTSARGSGVSTPWGTVGEVGLGTTPTDATLELGDQGQVWASRPQAVMVGSGVEQRAKQALGSNDFGYAGIGRVTVDDAATVSVSAIDRPDGKVSVSVTNNTEGGLTNVSVAGFSRRRSLVAVAPGATEAMDFEATKDLNPLDDLFPIDPGQDQCFDQFCASDGRSAFGRISAVTLAQRGRIEVSGTLRTPMNVGGNPHVTTFHVTAVAPVMPPNGDPASGAGTSLQVDTVGERIATEDDFGGVPGDVQIAPAPQPGVTTVEAPPDAVSEAGPQPTYVRVSSPIDLPSAQCTVHTVVDQAQRWNGTAWEPLPPNGAKFKDERFAEPNEAQHYPLPALKAGEAVFLRFTSSLPVNPAAAMNCAEAS